MASAAESKEYALKYQIARQSGLKNYEKEVGSHTLNCLVDMWKEYANDTIYRVSEENRARYCLTLREKIWKYVEENPAELWVRMNSELFGLKTTIHEYTNQKGVKSLTHFTANGYYCGTVKALGETPVHYEGNFRITQEHFTICFDRLDRMEKQDGFYNIRKLFKHKSEHTRFCSVCGIFLDEWEESTCGCNE